MRKTLLASAALAVLVLWAFYGFHFHAGPDGADAFNRPMADKIAELNLPGWREGIRFADGYRLLPRAWLWGLADTVRTDHRRLRPLLVDTPTTTALRQTVRARRDLVTHRVAVTNQLRAHLQIVFPGAVGLFHDLDSEISLRFLERFTTQDQADWLSPRRLAAWLGSVGYCGRVDPTVLHARLT